MDPRQREPQALAAPRFSRYSEAMLTRRTMLASGAATALFPSAGLAQTDVDTVLDGAAQLDQLHTVTVLVDGKTVVARRFAGPALGTAVNVKSVSKSVVAAVTGAAIDRGEIPGVATTIGDLAPRLLPAQAEDGARDITVEDLLTLRAGLERTSGANYGTWVNSPNWIAYALSRPFVAAPGGRMLYSTGSTHILGAVLAEATGRSLLDMARDWIGRPLGIEVRPWARDPQGYYLGGNEMAFTPTEMGVFGEMMRRNGLAADGTRVLSEVWVTESLRPRTASIWSGLGYGYGWFLGRHGGSDFALARGYGGQIITVVPDRATTIVITSDPTRPARSGGYFGDLMALIEGLIDTVETAS